MLRATMRVSATVIRRVVSLVTHLLLVTLLMGFEVPDGFLIGHLLLKNNYQYAQRAEQTSYDSAFVFLQETQIEFFQVT